MDTSAVVRGTTQVIASWSLQQQQAGFPAKLIQIATERALGAAMDKAKPIREAAWSIAFQDLLAHELSLQVDWMKRQAAFLTGSPPAVG